MNIRPLVCSFLSLKLEFVYGLALMLCMNAATLSYTKHDNHFCSFDAPGGEELDELAGLLVRFAGGVVQFLQLSTDLRQVAHAAPKTHAGRGGGRAEARVRHRRWTLPQEVKAPWHRKRNERKTRG